MINSLDVYRETGAKAGRAMNRRDQSLFQSLNNWFNRAKRLENEADRQAAQAAFSEGYCDERQFSR